MKTVLEIDLTFQESFKEEVKQRMPTLDPEWALGRFLEKLDASDRKTKQIVALMTPELKRSYEAMEKEHAATKPNQ